MAGEPKLLVSNHHTVLQELILAETLCHERLKRLDTEIGYALHDRALAAAVKRLQALRGARLICAETFMVEMGMCAVLRTYAS